MLAILGTASKHQCLRSKDFTIDVIHEVDDIPQENLTLDGGLDIQ
jgi:hypothetical protein